MKRNGQAMVEFMVAIIAVLVLFAGLVQVGLLSKADTDVMVKARALAGEDVVNPTAGEPAPDYISERTKGDDDVSYSVDDESSDGDAFEFQNNIVGYAHNGDLFARVGPNLVTDLLANPFNVMNGMVQGESSKDVPLLPVIRDMVYADESIKVKRTVWMVSGGEVF
jgi:hypothetical protein